MDMNVKQVNVTGNTAQARVEFKAKGSGAGMEMTYNLERQADGWVVKSSQNTGGLTHPPVDAGSMPPGSAPTGSGDLPAGHPQITTPSQPSSALPPGHPPVRDQGKAPAPPKKN